MTENFPFMLRASKHSEIFFQQPTRLAARMCQRQQTALTISFQGRSLVANRRS